MPARAHYAPPPSTAVLSAESYAPQTHAALFEVSWEAANQVGGIYQVLRSKARVMSSRWDDRYILVGPLVPEMVSVELEPEPAHDWLAAVIEDLQRDGIDCLYGRWMVAGRPRVLLVDPRLPPERIEVIRHRLQRDHGVPPARGNELVDGVLGFGEAVTSLLISAQKHCGTLRLLAHFHEWLAGTPILNLRTQGVAIATLFTTHATSVGRYVASSGDDLYAKLGGLDADAEAMRFGIETQHEIERRAARYCNVFTTVSAITAEECEHLLGRKPDLVTPNGLDISRFDLGHDFQTHHAQHKDQIHRFVMSHFFPSYSFDLEKTLYFFNAGRFEPRNKGFDVCLEALARVNAELREQDSETTVVFFIVTSREARSLEASALRARGLLDDLNENAHRIGRSLGERLFRASASGQDVAFEDLVDERWRLRHRRVQHAFATREEPLLCTHVLEDADQDPVIAHLRHLGLRNAAEDRVKVVYHPEFISSTNPLWGIDYDDFVRGCHLGLFPSQYEPWGYTPLECVAMGVPAITSDLAGFGRYVADAFPDHDSWGLGVLPRRDRKYHDAAADLTERVLGFCRMDRAARVALRNAVEAHSRAFDWSQVVAAYHEAHDRALASPTRTGPPPA